MRVGDSCVGVCMRLGTCMRGGEERRERRERRRERGTLRMRVQSACAAAGSAVTACILVCVCSIARRYAKSPGRRKAGAAETEHVDLSAPAQAPPPAPAPVPAPAAPPAVKKHALELLAERENRYVSIFLRQSVRRSAKAQR